MKPIVIAVKRPRDYSTPDTIIFESLPYVKRIRTQENNPEFPHHPSSAHSPPSTTLWGGQDDVPEAKRPRDCEDDGGGSRQKIRIDSVEAGVMYASISSPLQDHYDGDYEIEEYCPCDNAEAVQDAVDVDFVWGAVSSWHDQEDGIYDPYEHDSNEEGQDYPSSDGSEGHHPRCVPHRATYRDSDDYYYDYDPMGDFL